MEYISIPKERVAVLIGKDGEVKKKIESSSGVMLLIESDGRVTIDDSKSADSLKSWRVRDVVRAIGRGFVPTEAIQLFNDELVLEIIDLEQVLGNEKAVARQKSRIIGTGGKMRKFLELTLNMNMAIYGNTIGLIGAPEYVAIAKESIEKLISGAMHSTVIKFAEKKKREVENEGWSSGTDAEAGEAGGTEGTGDSEEAAKKEK